MKRKALLPSVLLVILIGTTWIGAATLERTMVPATAKWVFHVDMDQFRGTELHSYLKEKEDFLEIRAKSEEFSNEYGFNLLEDVTGITIFSPTMKETDAVVCVTGRLNQASLSELARKSGSYQEILYGNHIIMSWESEGNGVFYDENRILISKNAESLRATLDVLDGNAGSLATVSTLPYLDTIPANAFLAAVAENISSMVSEHTDTAVLKTTSMAAFMVLEENEKLSMTARLMTDTIESAQKIEQIVRGFIALVQLNQEKAAEWSDFIAALGIERTENELVLTFTYPTSKIIEKLSRDNLETMIDIH